MPNTALVQIKVDTETKTDVTNIYESLGLDLPTAVRWDIYKEARNSIQKNNVPEMSLDEINAEIAAVRAGK